MNNKTPFDPLQEFYEKYGRKPNLKEELALLPLNSPFQQLRRSLKAEGRWVGDPGPDDPIADAIEPLYISDEYPEPRNPRLQFAANIIAESDKVWGEGGSSVIANREKMHIPLLRKQEKTDDNKVRCKILGRKIYDLFEYDKGRQKDFAEDRAAIDNIRQENEVLNDQIAGIYDRVGFEAVGIALAEIIATQKPPVDAAHHLLVAWREIHGLRERYEHNLEKIDYFQRALEHAEEQHHEIMKRLEVRMREYRESGCGDPHRHMKREYGTELP